MLNPSYIMIPQALSLLLPLALLCTPVLADSNVQLTTTNSNFMSMVAGFSARMQCSLYRCISASNPAPTIGWFKDDVLLFNGTEFVASSGVEPSSIVLQRTISPESSNVAKDSCATEEYTLLLKNLTLQDAGEYRCQLINFPQQLDFHVDVLESGLKAGFHSRFTYDYTECCVERGLTPLCRSMCKPKMLKRSHRLCLYYLPEIFECFSKQYVLYPPQVPSNLRVKSTNGDYNTNKLCWKSVVIPPLKEEEVNYSIHVKEVSDLMMRGDMAMSAGKSEAVVSNELGVIQNHRRTKREPALAVVVAQESSLDKDTKFVKLDPKSIERGPNSEICASWTNIIKDGSQPRNERNRGRIRYVAYVQASNDYGTSEPSQPLFITSSSPLGQQQADRPNPKSA